jgi:hypothetical protein
MTSLTQVQPTPSTPSEIVKYYQNLLIQQYIGLPKASATIGAFAAMNIIPQMSVQTVSFSVVPTSGTFVLSYNGINSASINWNDSASAIQTKLQAISGLSSVTVLGSIASQTLTVTFTGVTPPALSLTVGANSLSPASVLTVLETDQTLPIAVQNAYNLIGPNTAVGVQLDVLGKYIGVKRTGLGFSTGTLITLDDADFLTLIQMGIIKNAAPSSLYWIQQYLQQFFPGSISVVDSTLMFLTFYISSIAISENLIQLFVSEGLLPVPMAVGTVIIYGPSDQYFSMVTYQQPTQLTGYPLNTYQSYNMSSPILQYQNVIIP